MKTANKPQSTQAYILKSQLLFSKGRKRTKSEVSRDPVSGFVLLLVMHHFLFVSPKGGDFPLK